MKFRRTVVRNVLGTFGKFQKRFYMIYNFIPKLLLSATEQLFANYWSNSRYLKTSHMKAYALYFITFYQIKAFQKLWKMYFFIWKTCNSRGIQFLVIFFFFSFISNSRFKGSDETRIIMTSWTSLHLLGNVIFGLTQKPFCIKSSKSLKKKLF